MEQKTAHPAISGGWGSLWSNPYLLLSLASLFWAGNFVVGRAVMDTSPPVALAFWRWALALIPVVWLGWRHIRRDLPALRAHLPILILLGLLGIGCFNTVVYLGLRDTTSINAMLLQSAMPILIFLAVFLLFGDRPRLVQIGGVILSLLGVAFIATGGNPADLSTLSGNRGDLWILAAVVAYTFYSALLRKRPPVHPLSFLAATFLVGALGILPFYIREHLGGHVLHLDPQTGVTLAYLVIFPSFLSYLFFNRGVELIGAGRAGLFVHLLPVFGSVLAVIFLGERFEAHHLIGAGLIATGLLVSSWCKRPTGFGG